MKWILWVFLLIVQNASFTLVSRARASASFSYHALSAIFSNGVWFASQFILIGAVMHDIKTWKQGLFIGSLYVVSTVIGSVLMHWIAMRWLEKGKRKVGATE